MLEIRTVSALTRTGGCLLSLIIVAEPRRHLGGVVEWLNTGDLKSSRGGATPLAGSNPAAPAKLSPSAQAGKVIYYPTQDVKQSI